MFRSRGPAERQARQRDSELPPHFHRTARVGIGRAPRKPTRNLIAPLPAAPPPRSAENRESSRRQSCLFNSKEGSGRGSRQVVFSALLPRLGVNEPKLGSLPGFRR